MTASQLAEYFDRFQTGTPGRSVLTIEAPPVVGWRTKPLEGHQLTNQLIRREHRPAADAPMWAKPPRIHQERKQSAIVQQLDASLRKSFTTHVKRWQEDTENVSSVSDLALHPAYQRIIGLGAPVLPLILRELEKSLDHWFWALHAISGENPVPPEEQGNMDAMRERWLEWGRKRGLIA